MGKIDYSLFAFGKPQHKKRVREPSRFPDKVAESIFERDGRRCVKCGSQANLERHPHHIIFRSQGGKGIKRNGATVCIYCHRSVHQGHETEKNRKWFVDWRDRCLDENGDLIV